MQELSYVPISSLSSQQSRIYLTEKELEDAYNFSFSRHIPLSDINNLQLNETLKTRIALIAFQLNTNPDLAVSLHFEPSPELETAEIVSETSQLVLFIYKQLLELKVDKKQLVFDGIKKYGEISAHGKGADYLITFKFFSQH